MTDQVIRLHCFLSSAADLSNFHFWHCLIIMIQINDDFELEKNNWYENRNTIRMSALSANVTNCTHANKNNMCCMSKHQELRVWVSSSHFHLTSLISTEKISSCICYKLHYLRYEYLRDYLNIHMSIHCSNQTLTQRDRSNTQSLITEGSADLFWSLCWAYIEQFFVILLLAEMTSMLVSCRNMCEC